MSLNISLPQGFEHVSGNLTWMGFIGPNETVNTTAVIKANQTGDFVINARAGPPPKGSIVRRSLFVSVSENTANVSNESSKCSGNQTEVRNCMRKPLLQTVNESFTSNSSLPGGFINVFGCFGYRDNNNQDHPARFQQVELFDQDLFGEVLLATGFTGNDGCFAFYGISNDDGLFEGGMDIFLKIWDNFSNPPSGGMFVTDGNIFHEPYWARIPNEGNFGNVPDGDLFVGSYVVIGEGAGAWGIYEWDVREYLYLKDEVGWIQPKIEVIWPSEEPDPFFNEVLYYIGIPNGFEWDEDANQHEYGHAVMFKAYGNNPPPSPGIGGLWDEVSLGYAFVEGWADFITSAVQNDPDYAGVIDLETGIMTCPDGVERYVADCLDFGDMDGDIIEGAVATTFFDIYDGADDDGVPANFNNLWNVLKDDRPNDINEFWTDWFNRGYNYLPEMNQMYWDHRIDQNNPPTATILSPNGGGWYNGIITVSASASDSDGTVSQVEFQYSLDNSNWVTIGTDTSPAGGWGISWNTGSITDPTVWVRARAFDDMEYSPYDSSDSSFGVDNSLPGTPTLFDPGDYDSDGSYLVDWTDVSDSGSGLYRYQLQEDTSSNFNNPTNYYPTASQQQISGNTVGNTYYYRVRAEDNAGNLGGWSNTESINIGLGPGDLCSSGSECYSSWCEGSANFSARCCNNQPSTDGWVGGGNDPLTCGPDPDSQYLDYYCDVSGNEQIDITASQNCDDQDQCENYCDGDTAVYGLDYFVILNTGTCTSESTSEDCTTKASEDSDGGNFPLTAGYCFDYTGCSSGACTEDQLDDVCNTSTLLTEYYANGAVCSSQEYSCSNFEVAASGETADDPTTTATCTGGTGASCIQAAQGYFEAISQPDGTDTCTGTCGTGENSCQFVEYFAADSTDACPGLDECTSTTYDADTNSNTCGTCGQDWNIGGEVDPTACCGDDAEENSNERVCDPGICASDPSDVACCDSSSDCVYSNTCYSDGFVGDVDSDSQDEECVGGTWKEPVNDPPTTPTSLFCDSGSCNGQFAFSININCSGSTDPDGDPITYFAEAFYNGTAENWWNDSWEFRRRITITNNNLSAPLPEGYTVNITFDTTGGNFLDNGDDVRVVYNNSIELNRINATAFNSSSTVIWFRTNASIPGGGNDTNYWVYYGNANAGSPPESKRNVYWDWTGFEPEEGYSEDLLENHPDWEKVSGTGSFEVTPNNPFEGTFALNSTTGFPTYNKTGTNVIPSHFKMEAFLRANNTGGCCNSGPRVYILKDVNNFWVTGYDSNDPHAEHDIFYCNGKEAGVEKGVFSNAPPEKIGGVYYKVTMKLFGNLFTCIFENDTVQQTLTFAINDENNFDNSILRIYSDTSGGKTFYHDSIAVMKYLEPEPTATLGGEEGGGLLWKEIGSHNETSSLDWNITDIQDQSGVDLRCRAIDVEGSNTYSAYFDPPINITILNDMSPPSVTITSPTNTTYTILTLSLETTVTDPSGIDSCWYSLDNWQINITYNCSSTTFIASEGPNTIRVAANDSVGNLNAIESVSFTVETISLSITINSPENITYATASIDLNWSVNKELDWCAYSLNGEVNNTRICFQANFTGETFDATPDIGGVIVAIATNNTNFWVTEGEQKRVCLYDMEGNQIHCQTGVPGNPNLVPHGITMNASYIWVTNVNSPGNITQLWPNFSFHSELFSTKIGGNAPRDITHNNTHFWITYKDSRIVQSFLMNGTSVQNFTHAGTSPVGIDTDNNFIWIVDDANLSIFEYHMDGAYTGRYYDISEIMDNTKLPNFQTLPSPYGLVQNGSSFWITRPFDNNVYKFHQSPPTQGNVTITAQEGFNTLTVYANDTIGNMNSSTIYFTVDTILPTIVIDSPSNTSYATTSIWLNWSVDETLDWCAFSLNGEANDTRICFQNKFDDSSSSINLSYTEPTSKMINIKLPKYSIITSAKIDLSGYQLKILNYSGSSFTVATSPHGIDNNETHLWIAGFADNKIYIYDLSDGSLHSSFNTDRPDFPSGITQNRSFIWIIYESFPSDDTVFKYYMNGTYTGENFSIQSSSFFLDNNNTNIFVTSQDSVETYNMSGSQIQSFSVTNKIPSANAWGIDFDGNYIWLTDEDGGKVFQYYPNGTFIDSYSITHIFSGAIGITSNESFFWISNSAGSKIYKFYKEPLKDFPTDIMVDTATDGIIDFSLMGELNLTNSPIEVDLNITAIENFLSDCVADTDGFCSLPLNLSVDSIGILQVSNIRIKYQNSSIRFSASEGLNNIAIYANDTAGNINSSTTYFTVDTTPPTITTDSPQNTTYNTLMVDLNVSANEQIDSWWYFLNEGTNTTFIPNTTIIGIEGYNTITVFTNDTLGNEGLSIISFTINLTFDLTNFTIIYANSTQRIFYFVINNLGDSALSNVTWTLDTGNGNKTSNYNDTLQPGEDVFVFIYHNYSTSGSYLATAYAYSNELSDSESLEVEV